LFFLKKEEMIDYHNYYLVCSKICKYCWWRIF